MTEASATAWEGRAAQEWAECWGVPRLLILESVDSTNDVVRRLASAGAPAGTLVMAEHQTAGRGRLGRSWADAPARSILFSTLFRPPSAAAPGTAPLRVGIAVANAIRSSTGLSVRLKWPNDILCDERKIAGILCEAVTGGPETSIIVGVGINVNQQRDDFPPDLRGTAISLAEAAGRPLSRAEVMTDVARGLVALARRPMDALDDGERAAYAEIDALTGRPVSVSEPAARGIARGVDSDGALLIDTAGTVLRVTSATVRPLGGAATQPSSRRP